MEQSAPASRNTPPTPSHLHHQPWMRCLALQKASGMPHKKVVGMPRARLLAFRYFLA